MTFQWKPGTKGLACEQYFHQVKQEPFHKYAFQGKVTEHKVNRNKFLFSKVASEPVLRDAIVCAISS